MKKGLRVNSLAPRTFLIFSFPFLYRENFYGLLARGGGGHSHRNIMRVIIGNFVKRTLEVPEFCFEDVAHKFLHLRGTNNNKT